MQKFVLTITPVDEFPAEPPEAADDECVDYAYLEANSFSDLCRAIAVKLNAEVYSDSCQAVYTPGLSSLPTSYRASS